MQHIGDSGGMIAQRSRQTFTGFHLSRTQRTRTFARGAGFSPFGGGPCHGIGSRHPWTQCNRITRAGRIFDATRSARKRLAIVLNRHDHEPDVKGKDGQRRTPDPPWPDRAGPDSEGRRPIDGRAEPPWLPSDEPLNLPLPLKTHSYRLPLRLDLPPGRPRGAGTGCGARFARSASTDSMGTSG